MDGWMDEPLQCQCQWWVQPDECRSWHLNDLCCGRFSLHWWRWRSGGWRSAGSQPASLKFRCACVRHWDLWARLNSTRFILSRAEWACLWNYLTRSRLCVKQQRDDFTDTHMKPRDSHLPERNTPERARHSPALIYNSHVRYLNSKTLHYYIIKIYIFKHKYKYKL